MIYETNMFGGKINETEDNFLRDQIIAISKAGAYDVIKDQVAELKAENERLRKIADQWQKLATDYRQLLSEYKQAVNSL